MFDRFKVLQINLQLQVRMNSQIRIKRKKRGKVRNFSAPLAAQIMFVLMFLDIGLYI
jgi:hypothetical protein